jgi:hypothetical protein
MFSSAQFSFYSTTGDFVGLILDALGTLDPRGAGVPRFRPITVSANSPSLR